MNILIATIQVPFVQGGAEIMAEDLRAELLRAGAQAEIVTLPFPWDDQNGLPRLIDAARLIDLSSSALGRIDRVIGLRFPAYLIPHPDKVLWLVHQHRSAYDLADFPFGVGLATSEQGRAVQRAICEADRRWIPEHRRCLAISRTVAARLEKYSEIAAEVVYPPPRGAERFRAADPESFFFFPSRIGWFKRQSLVLRALALTRQPVRVAFSGRFESPDYRAEIDRVTRALGPEIEGRVRWLGWLSEEEKLDAYARCLGVLFPPLGEDLGYITLEAMLASKPVITCTDSGGVLEFVRDGISGRITEPEPAALARAMDELWADPRRAARMGREGRGIYDSLGISWERVLSGLLS